MTAVAKNPPEEAASLANQPGLADLATDKKTDKKTVKAPGKPKGTAATPPAKQASPAGKAPAKPKGTTAEPPAKQASSAGKTPGKPKNTAAERPAEPDPPEQATSSAPEAAGEPSSTELVRRLRLKRALALLLRFGIVVVLPTALAAVYYGLIAAPQFESHAVFTIHSSERQQSLALVASLLGAVSSSPATHDTLAAREYVLSRDMLKLLDSRDKIIAHYKNPSADRISRLASDATFEEAYDYYLDKVLAEYDTTTGSLSLRVRAFSASKVQSIAKDILALCEDMVNNLTERERADQMRVARTELQLAESRLSKARQNLLKLQQEHSELSPTHSAQAAISIRTALEGELAKARAELMQLRAYMNPEAPQIRVLNERIRSLSAQVSQESHRLVDPKGKNGIAESMGAFEAAAAEKEFAEKAYASAWAAVELARSDASRQHRYLVEIAEPSKPDESTYPRRAMAVLTVFLVSLVCMGIGTLLVAAVREHARV